MRVLVTGAAGFIGFHTARRLLARGDAVTGLVLYDLKFLLPTEASDLRL